VAERYADGLARDQGLASERKNGQADREALRVRPVRGLDPVQIVTRWISDPDDSPVRYLRAMCVRRAIGLLKANGKHKMINDLNDELGKAGAYNALKKKQITAWADLRNNAAHGNTRQTLPATWMGCSGTIPSLAPTSPNPYRRQHAVVFRRSQPTGKANLRLEEPGL
jgi:hypothetical protein